MLQTSLTLLTAFVAHQAQLLGLLLLLSAILVLEDGREGGLLRGFQAAMVDKVCCGHLLGCQLLATCFLEGIR